ncbi:flagellar biosynthetic protein FliO [Sedimentibacter sp.]|uniref:flagellar biosynthetic protein FliO n=1 Tax=Sedimentibacter sp. TaxID=1960295 RepID=UPI0028A04AC0|nr:flagellar biosynthetic protein FliO [Sedimentibacter sp.]
MLFLTYYSTKWLSTRTSSSMKSRYINIIDKIMLGQNKFLAIAEVCNKYYLLSITEKNITIVKELDDFQPIPDIKPDNNLEFNNILNKFLKR